MIHLSTTPQRVLRLGIKMIGRDYFSDATFVQRQFKSLFGTTPFLCVCLWDELNHSGEGLLRSCKVVHLLWTLLFLKCYSVEAVHAAICRCNEKTLRKWVWYLLEKICMLNVVSICWLQI